MKANLGEKLFAEFDVDLGAGDVRLWPFEKLTSRNLLSFAGIADCPPFPSISAEQHFAEKVHAYSLPRGERTNTRIKDMIDMVLLTQKGSMNNAKAVDALHKTFDRRNTHPLSAELSEPPEAWAGKFAELAAECKLGCPLGNPIKLGSQRCRQWPIHMGKGNNITNTGVKRLHNNVSVCPTHLSVKERNLQMGRL